MQHDENAKKEEKTTMEKKNKKENVVIWTISHKVP